MSVTQLMVFKEPEDEISNISPYRQEEEVLNHLLILFLVYSTVLRILFFFELTYT